MELSAARGSDMLPDAVKIQITRKAEGLSKVLRETAAGAPPGGERPFFTPHLLFLGETQALAEAAASFAAQEFCARELLPSDRVAVLRTPELLERQQIGAESLAETVKAAVGGVLLLRDFHALSRYAMQGSAVEQTLNALLQALRENRSRLCVIPEGFSEDVRWLLRQNAALSRRFPHKIYFEPPVEGRLWHYRVCRCCGSPLRGDDCDSCGFRNARLLNDRSLVPALVRGNDHRSAMAGRIGAIGMTDAGDNSADDSGKKAGNGPAAEVGRDPGLHEDSRSETKSRKKETRIKNFILKGAALVRYRGAEETVTIPAGVETIPPHAFINYEKIRRLCLPEGVREIGDYAFSNFSRLETVDLPESLRSVGNYVFGNCRSLKRVRLPAGMQSLGKNLFSYCVSLEEATLPPQIAVIRKRTFWECGALRVFDVPAGVRCIEKNAFYACKKLRRLSLPEGLEQIDEGAFLKCVLLEDVRLPATLRSLGPLSFGDCASLTEITIPGSLKVLRKETFVNCKSLRKVTVEPGVEMIEPGAFTACGKTLEIAVPHTLKLLPEIAVGSTLIVT